MGWVNGLHVGNLCTALLQSSKSPSNMSVLQGERDSKVVIFFLQLSSKMHTWGHSRGRHNPALYLLRNLFSPLTHISKLRRSPLHVSCFSQFPTTANNHPFACRRAAARTLLRIFQVTHSFLAHPGPAEAYFIPKTLKQELLVSVCSSASSCDRVSAHHLSGG